MAEISQKVNGIPLPPELLGLITKRLRKPDLKSLRLVCRSLRPWAAPLLFDQVTFSPSSRALNRAKETVLHFGEYVKTLFYFPVQYRILSFEEFQDFAHSLCDNGTMQKCIRQDDEDGHIDDLSFQHHIEHSFHSYSSRAQEQLEMEQTGAHLAHLCHILSKIPKAKKLVIGSTGAYSHLGMEDMRHLGIDLRDLCPRIDCILSPEEHVLMQPVPFCFTFADIRDFLHPAMLALHATASAITKLDIQVNKYQDEASALLSISAFDRTTPESRYVTFRLSTLTMLRLDLGICTRDALDEFCFNQGNVTDTLATARNLECLYISLTPAFVNSLRDPYSLFTFEGILGGCRFPKLKSLVLECFKAKPAKLLEFLTSFGPTRSAVLARFQAHGRFMGTNGGESPTDPASERSGIVVPERIWLGPWIRLRAHRLQRGWKSKISFCDGARIRSRCRQLGRQELGMSKQDARMQLTRGVIGLWRGTGAG